MADPGLPGGSHTCTAAAALQLLGTRHPSQCFDWYLHCINAVILCEGTWHASYGDLK